MAQISVVVKNIAKFAREQGIQLETGKKKEAPSRFQVTNWAAYQRDMEHCQPAPNIYGRKVTAILLNGVEVARADSKRQAIEKAKFYRSQGKVTYRTIEQAG